MKRNKVERRKSRGFGVTVCLVLLIALAVGVVLGFSKLRELWRDLSIVRDYSEQVHVESGKMVKADVIAGILGLKPGANLAEIDFAARRAEVLKRIPNLRELTIERRLPDRICVRIEEREPIARLGLHGQRGETGKVVDTEGVVFSFQRGTKTLPIIRESAPPGTGVGRRLEGRARAALRLVEACREPALQELGVLDVDLVKTDFLTATLGATYSTAKIAWTDMDEDTPASRAHLNRQLRHLVQAIRSRIGDGALIWNATDLSVPGRIWADTKGNL